MQTNTTITESRWLAEENLIVTHLSGEVSTADVQHWEQSLQTALDEIPDGNRFKIFVNIYGFKAVDLEAHKRFRVIIPLTLADYGFRVGYVDLFENVDLPLRRHRGVKCVAAAHAHQDASKIDEYERRFGRERERFFTDPVTAENWIKNCQI